MVRSASTAMRSQSNTKRSSLGAHNQPATRAHSDNQGSRRYLRPIEVEVGSITGSHVCVVSILACPSTIFHARRFQSNARAISYPEAALCSPSTTHLAANIVRSRSNASSDVALVSSSRQRPQAVSQTVISDCYIAITRPELWVEPGHLGVMSLYQPNTAKMSYSLQRNSSGPTSDVAASFRNSRISSLAFSADARSTGDASRLSTYHAGKVSSGGILHLGIKVEDSSGLVLFSAQS
jgi:hypothetical protein